MCVVTIAINSRCNCLVVSKITVLLKLPTTSEKRFLCPLFLNLLGRSAICATQDCTVSYSLYIGRLRHVLIHPHAAAPSFHTEPPPKPSETKGALLRYIRTLRLALQISACSTQLVHLTSQTRSCQFSPCSTLSAQPNVEEVSDQALSELGWWG